uniref:Uncharacterized protein n=1 Tax=Arundo donax TaxID=35708 RepID=A0A0A9AVU8_ARUDO
MREQNYRCLNVIRNFNVSHCFVKANCYLINHRILYHYYFMF